MVTQAALMLRDLTLDDFKTLVGEIMDLSNGREVCVARLLEARDGSSGSAGFRQAFSLLIRADMTEHFWPQGTYTLRHQALGEFELFMVPIGPDAEGMRYQISFN